MGSRRGPEQTIGQQNFKMKFLLVLCLLGLVAGSEDYKMFMKWAKTKAMESCWGEDNMNIYTVNMKKAVAKCQQKDVPELDLPPLRAINRMINNYNGPMRNLAKIKSFMNCCKTAKMKLCMYQDTKKKIETNFGPVDQLLEGFNNQITEEQVFYMVNELLQGDDDEFM